MVGLVRSGGFGFDRCLASKLRCGGKLDHLMELSGNARAAQRGSIYLIFCDGPTSPTYMDLAGEPELWGPSVLDDVSLIDS